MVVRDARRLEEMLAVIDHLSPTVLIDNRAVAWDAIRLMARDGCVELIDRRLDWSETMTKLRKSVSRYSGCIENIDLMFDLDLDASSLMTMEDGTPVTGGRGIYTGGGRRFSTVSLMRVAGPEAPSDLIHHVYLGNVEEVKRIAESGVDVNARRDDTDGGTALGAALSCTRSEGHRQVIQYLIDRPDIDVHDTDCHGNTLLHRTISKMTHASLCDFINHKVDTHLQNMFGRNVLHELVRTHRQDFNAGLMMAELLNRGSGTLLLTADNSGFLPLDFVTEKDDVYWEIASDKAVDLKLATVRALTAIVLSLVPVSALATLIMGYYTVA